MTELWRPACRVLYAWGIMAGVLTLSELPDMHWLGFFLTVVFTGIGAHGWDPE